MPAPIIPWMPHNVPSEIQSELNRRKTNRSFSFVANQSANWNKDGDWNTYKGPMTSWIRVCSNSGGPVDSSGNFIKPRFVFYGGKGFHQTYGFSKSATGANQQIIGWQPSDFESGYYSKEPHVIENSLITPAGGNYPIYVPTPEISRIQVVVQKELFRRATIEWVCFSKKQLEYMSPYFLVPGITVMLEWGWNHFNPKSLVPLNDSFKMKQLWKNSYPLYTDNIILSNGNYDVLYGIITNFNWSVEGNKIICSTEITSKDRLYAGLAKDTTLTVNNPQEDIRQDEPPEIFQNIRKFLEKDDTIKNIKRIANSPNPELEIGKINSPIWSDIFRYISSIKSEQLKLFKMSHLHGVFSGRTREDEIFGIPQPTDFDNKTPEGDTSGDKLWLSMGLIVEILNYFSALPGGNEKPMFSVDIMNSVIGGHPNLISCDSRVLVPNAKAPKFHYGRVGIANTTTINTRESEYYNQYVEGTSVNTPADIVLNKTFYQTKGLCFRNDLNVLINRFRIRNVNLPSSYYSFPSSTDDFSNSPLPDNPNGLRGNYMEKDYSGLLSNLYVNFNAFKEIILNQDTSKFSYVSIYNELFSLLMNSVDGFWDLALVEVENTMTVADKKYIGKKPISDQGDSVYVFEYYDSDGLIKSFKFSPKLSDAQATRAIYGGINNTTSKYALVDKNDLLNFDFKDAINYNEKERVFDDSKSAVSNKSLRNRDNLKSMLSKVQVINQTNDPALQMTIPNFQDEREFEVIKLVLPDQELLRLLLDDKDEENNSRYSAVQPGIIAELTLQGIGGLRTFQYFLVKNLPEPYSENNIIFRITDVHSTLETGNWETVIRAQISPLRNYIKNRLLGPLPDGSWPPRP